VRRSIEAEVGHAGAATRMLRMMAEAADEALWPEEGCALTERRAASITYHGPTRGERRERAARRSRQNVPPRPAQARGRRKGRAA
jgi:hypothetical protein